MRCKIVVNLLQFTSSSTVNPWFYGDKEVFTTTYH